MAETGRQRWTERVEQWKQSGLSARECASQAGLNAGTLWHWKCRRVEVELSNGHRLRVPAGLEPVDMRCGFDRLALLARERVGHDPPSGALFVFRGKRATRLKVLWFDRHGYRLL